MDYNKLNVASYCPRKLKKKCQYSRKLPERERWKKYFSTFD